ncbi:hypothetical protein AOX59_18525 [Lentibacillus amyloliquefaciens]|uniref:AMP-dependent synthetase/ligase domain-containing protein n=2 Tax=Lentibacillus amyloliquefaciens TaxID=1472767 RepID=A0A0U4FIM2_9BACI|nr:hypothetical protein AOX59_18525 [Lentibacillus amyloliquefaciens]
MISGSNYWNETINKNLTMKRLNNKEYQTFDNMNQNMYQVLKKNVNEAPHKIGVVDTNGENYTYDELLDLADKLSSYLIKELQIEKGKHIGLLLYNSVEFIIAFLAAQKLGAVIVPFPTKYKEPEIVSLVEKSHCDLLIVDKAFHSWVQKNNDNVILCDSQQKKNLFDIDLNEYEAIETSEIGSLEDVAILMFTSGTTSHSKGVVIRNFNIQHAITSYHRILDVDEKDSTILAIPIYNVTGLIATVSLFLKCKGTIHIHKFFDPKQVLSDIQEHGISFYHASPTIFTLMLEEMKSFSKLPSLTKIACGGANMPAEQIKELKEWLPNMEFRTIYGLSETASPATIFPTDASQSHHIGSSGQPIPGLSIKIVDDFENELPVCQTGEILLKGTNVIAAYYNQQSDLITDDNWLKTGDIGYINKDGYLYVVDRKKDLINRGGEKIYSMDVENVIRQIGGLMKLLS